MTTEDDFQTALDANPEDWQTRLVFADWLEDNGDPQRADFIRTQCRAAALDEDDFDRFDLEEHALRIERAVREILAAVGVTTASIARAPDAHGFSRPRHARLRPPQPRRDRQT